MSSARAQVARLLALVPLISARGELPIDKAAATLGIDPDVLVADLRVLMYCGWPGWMPGDLIEVDLDALDEHGMIRIHNADYLTTPLRLSGAEASALGVALCVLRDSVPDVTLSVVDSVLAKLAVLVADRPEQVTVSPAADARRLQQLRTTLNTALDRGLRVRLDYHVPARDEDTSREVDPIAVVDRPGVSYLRAWCRSAGEERLFRLDRVLAVELLDQPAAGHARTPSALSDGLFAPTPNAPLVSLRLAPAARWVAEYYPVEMVREAGQDYLDVDLRVADPAWLQRLLLRLTPDVEVLGDEPAAAAYRSAVRRTLALYRGTGA